MLQSNGWFDTDEVAEYIISYLINGTSTTLNDKRNLLLSAGNRETFERYVEAILEYRPRWNSEVNILDMVFPVLVESEMFFHVQLMPLGDILTKVCGLDFSVETQVLKAIIKGGFMANDINQTETVLYYWDFFEAPEWNDEHYKKILNEKLPF